MNILDLTLEHIRQAFFEDNPDPMFLTDVASLIFLDVNKSACEHYGYSREEFLTLTVRDIRPEEDIPDMLLTLDSLKAGLNKVGIWRHRKKSGEIMHVYVSNHMVEFDGKRAFLATVRDVSRLVLLEQEREAAKSRLQEQEANWRNAQRLLGIGAWKLDLGTGYLDRSDNVYAMYGVTEEVMGHSFEDYLQLVHPEDRARFAAEFAAFEIKPGAVFDFTHRIMHGDGSTLTIRGVGEVADTPEGQVITGVVQDLSPQIETQARLAAADDLLRIASRTARLGAWQLDLNKAEIRFSEETAQFYDLPGVRTLSLESTLAYFAPESRQKLRALLHRCVQESQPFDARFMLTTAMGRKVVVRCIGEPIANAQKQVTQVRGAIQDITELDSARQKIESLSQRLLNTFENMSDAFFLLDQNLCFSYINHEAERLLGREAGSLLGKNIWHEFPALAATRVRAEYEQALVTGKSVDIIEPKTDGSLMLHIKAFPSGDGLAVYFQDVTDRLAMEERLRHALKMEAVGQLTGGVAHDFNNLLTVILGNAELLREQLSEKPRLKTLAEMSVKAAERGAELTNRLLAFARRQALDPKIVDVNALIQGMDGLLRRTLTGDFTIELQLHPAAGLTEIDPGQLEVALLNLAINARDAMLHGGLLTIETGNVVLDASYARDGEEVIPGNYVLVSVSDSGTGMSQEILRRAFDPFFTTKDSGKGSGLGLSMVYGFIRQSRGYARIYSEVGEGTTVRLYLPRADADARVDEEQPETERTAGGNEHILVVEDDALVRDNLVQRLRELGYRVSVATAGQEALALLESGESFELLFTDVVMPGGMNGRQLAELAKQRWPNLKILFTSGYTENAIVHQGRLDAGVQLLSKPYRLQELASKVRMVLDMVDKQH